MQTRSTSLAAGGNSLSPVDVYLCVLVGTRLPSEFLPAHRGWAEVVEISQKVKKRVHIEHRIWHSGRAVPGRHRDAIDSLNDSVVW